MSDGKPNARKSEAAGSSSGGGASKRRKVNHACLYCRRSHMHCDENRPCARCIKRDIGHLCHDEVKPPPPKQSSTDSGAVTPTPSMASTSLPTPTGMTFNPAPTPTFQPPAFTPLPGNVPAMKVDGVGMYSNGAGSTPFVAPGSVPTPGGMNSWPLISDPNTFFQTDTTPTSAGGEFSVLSQFLENLDANQWFNAAAPPPPQVQNPMSSMQPTPLMQQQQTGSSSSLSAPSPMFGMQPTPQTILASMSPEVTQQLPPKRPEEQTVHELEHVDPLPPSTKTERFLLTAADQESGTRDERLKSVIRAKYEAALLKPYNYVKGYARLSRWMERNVSPESRQAILQPISVLRPKFRGIAQNLKDIDLVYVEEAFERLLLDYDRVFSAMGIPACLWRRTGEIYKANKSFADLVGIDVSKMRDGRLCIYELMSENSAVNYWEKYGHVAFDAKQKAVLTSCVLRFKPNLPALQPSTAAGTPKASAVRRRAGGGGDGAEETSINCCFSFTIRRDIWGIPSMIVGNFIKC